MQRAFNTQPSLQPALPLLQCYLLAGKNPDACTVMAKLSDVDNAHPDADIRKLLYLADCITLRPLTQPEITPAADTPTVTSTRKRRRDSAADGPVSVQPLAQPEAVPAADIPTVTTKRKRRRDSAADGPDRNTKVRCGA